LLITIGSSGLSPGAVSAGRDRVDDLLRLVVGDLAEDRVLAVQMRGRHDGDEELRAVGAAAVLDPAFAIASRYGRSNWSFRVDLVVELVPPACRCRCRAGSRPGS